MRICRAFFVTVLCIGAAGLPWAVGAEMGRLTVTHGPYLQAVTESSVTVVWFTNKKCVSRVEYSAAGADGAPTPVYATRHGLVEANSTMHKIRLTGLEPGQPYTYRIISREIVRFDPYQVIYGATVTQGPYRLRTWDADKDAISFYVVNDIHEDAARLDSLLETVSWEGADMVVLNGDMLDYLTEPEQIFDGFLDVCIKRFARQIPFAYVRGNHEARGALARALIDYFPTPNDEYYYSFRHGPVGFLVLDCGEDKPDSSKEYSGLVAFDAYRARQTQWLKGAVRAPAFAEARYRIVFVHMPPVGNPRAHGRRQLQEQWSPILGAANIDLVVSAHTHHYARIDPNEAANRYPILINAPETLLDVKVSRDQLDVTVRKIDGAILDTLSLKPNSDE